MGDTGTTRPPAIMAAAVILFVVGALNVISAFLVLRLGGVWLVLALLALLIGAAAIYAGWLILQLREQGRIIGMVIAGISLLFGLYTLIAQANYVAIIGLLLNGYVLYVLFTSEETFARA